MDFRDVRYSSTQRRGNVAALLLLFLNVNCKARFYGDHRFSDTKIYHIIDLKLYKSNHMLSKCISKIINVPFMGF